jgi:predicted DNA-binding protein (UPF0278 family)
MIKIKTQNTNSSSHLLSDAENAIFNEYIKPIKERLESKLKDAECDIHKSESKGTITLKSTDNKIEFAYSDFCCDDFKEKFIE